MAKEKTAKRGLPKLSPIQRAEIRALASATVIKLNAKKFGLAGGIICGLFVALMTLVGILGYFSELNALLVSIYGFMKYSISCPGICLGAIYGFIDGFVFFWAFAKIYNKILRW